MQQQQQQQQQCFDVMVTCQPAALSTIVTTVTSLTSFNDIIIVIVTTTAAVFVPFYFFLLPNAINWRSWHWWANVLADHNRLAVIRLLSWMELWNNWRADEYSYSRTSSLTRGGSSIYTFDRPVGDKGLRSGGGRAVTEKKLLSVIC